MSPDGLSGATRPSRDRRSFLAATALASAGLFSCTAHPAGGSAPHVPPENRSPQGRKRAPVHKTDVLVVGAGVGGIAAALAVLRDHHTVVLTEPTAWVGGQLTAQGVPPDEHSWVEDGLASNASYRELRANVRKAFLRTYPATEEARRTKHLDPGRSWASLFTAEPALWHSEIRSVLQPYEATRRLTLLTKTKPVRASAAGGIIRSVRFDSPDGLIDVEATYVIDASELGDLLPLAGIPYVVGREAGRGPHGTQEPHNIWDSPDAKTQQSFTMVAALGFAAAHDGIAVRSLSYSKNKQHFASFPANKRLFDPSKDWAWDKGHNYWQYRRVRFHGYLTDAFLGDITLLNQRENDCSGQLLVPPAGATGKAAYDKAIGVATEKTKSLVQYFQLDYPRPDGSGTGWGGLFLAPDVLGTDSGLAQHPYVRESRRIKAVTTIRQQDVAVGNAKGPASSARPQRAKTFVDSVGVGAGPIDIHPTRSHPHGLFLPTYPFQIPLSALRPAGWTNVLAGAKNLGTTHFTNGSYRYHPVEWSIGEAAGHAVAFALRKDTTIASLMSSWKDLAAYLDARGVQREWSDDHARVEIRSFHST